MGKTKPILQAVVSEWGDEVTEYGVDDSRDGSLELYILAHRNKDYEIKREEDGPEMPLVETQYRLFSPDELSVDQYNGLAKQGFHFHTITERDLVNMLDAGFDGRGCGRA